MNKEIIYKNTERIPYEKSVSVKEYKAPTDESVRLLLEMQEKAELNIVKKLIINDNVVNGAVLGIEQSCGEFKIHVKFNLNGVEHILFYPISHIDYINHKYDDAKFKRYLYRALSETLTTELLKYSLSVNALRS